MLLAIVAAASAIFAAAVIGLPITNKLAPSESACSGVAMRFWSPASDPAGRTPDRRGARAGADARGARLSLLVRHAGRGGADRSGRQKLLCLVRNRDPRDRQGLERPRHP